MQQRSRLRRAAVAATASLAVAAMTFGAPVSADAATASNILLGIFPGYTPVEATTEWVDKSPATQVMFTDWDPASLPAARSSLNTIWNSGSVPVLTWEVFTSSQGRTAPADIDRRIADGEHDDYVDSYASMLRHFLAGPDARFGTGDDRRVYLRFAHEMNGTWYPWSPDMASADQTPADYVAMWRHVHKRFTADGLGDRSRLQWMWVPMNCDCGSTRLEEYFPGRSYVDWVGIDAYNWGTSNATGSTTRWQQPEPLMRTWLDRVAALDPAAPIAVPETGSSSSGGDKRQWFNDLAGFTGYYTSPTGSRIHMLSYFNIDKETDWGVLTDGGAGDETFRYGETTYAGYSTYRQMVQRTNTISPSPGNRRVLTNAQFAGTF